MSNYKQIDKNCNECEHFYIVYEEHDTGYIEAECGICGDNFDVCPFNFKYRVIKE